MYCLPQNLFLSWVLSSLANFHVLFEFELFLYSERTIFFYHFSSNGSKDHASYSHHFASMLSCDLCLLLFSETIVKRRFILGWTSSKLLVLRPPDLIMQFDWLTLKHLLLKKTSVLWFEISCWRKGPRVVLYKLFDFCADLKYKMAAT